MSQETLFTVVRVIALLIILLISYIIWRLFKWADDAEREERQYGRKASDGSTVPSEHADNWDIQRTASLNPGFFGSDTAVPRAEELPNAPSSDFPIAIMARAGTRFSGAVLQDLVRVFGFTRSPIGVYELINKNGRDVLFSMLNIHAPGTFAADLETAPPVEGVLLVMQLPNGSDALESFETLLAMANEMCAHAGGRLCSFKRKPLSQKDLLAYREAVAAFQQEYNSWLAEHQNRRRR